MQKVTDFLLKYKKYFGAAALFLVLVIVLVSCTEPKNQKNDNTENGTTATETQNTQTEYELDGKLQKDADPELVTLMQNYYTAYANGDLETLETLAQPLSDNEKSYIGTFSDYYENYQNIVCYSMPGATEDSYLVSVCYDLKFYEVDTLAPGMDFFYVERDGKGNLFINNVYSAYNFNFMDQELEANLYSMILAYEKSDEVVKIQNEVQSRYDEAVKSDEKLANMVGGTLRNAMAKWRDSVIGDAQTETQAETQADTQNETQNTEVKQEETQKEEIGKDDSKKEDKEDKKEEADDEPEMVKTLDICNVRKKPSTDAELLGRVDIGVKLEKLGTKGEWTKVKFQGKTGYIKSDLLKAVKKKS